MQIISSLGKKLKPSRLPWYGSAAYLSDSSFMGMGGLLCDPTGKGIGELILKRAAPAALEKKDSKGRAAFQLGPPYFGVSSFLVTEPDDVKCVMHDNKTNIYNYDYLKNFATFLGESNILSMPNTDPRWKIERKRLENFLFKLDVLEKDIPAINTMIDGIFTTLNEKSTVFDLEEFSAHYTLDVVARTKLGIVEFPDEVKAQISKFITNVAIELGNASGHFKKAMVPLLNYFPFSYCFPAKKVNRYFNPKVHKLIDDGNVFIREKLLTPKNLKSIPETDNWITAKDESKVKDPDIKHEQISNYLDKALSYLQPYFSFDSFFTDTKISTPKIPENKEKDEKSTDTQIDLMSEEVRDRIVQFLSAGTETTSRLVMHGLMTLGLEENAAIVEKLREEFKRVKNGDVRTWTIDDFEKKLPYFNAFIDELLRLYPSIPVMVVVGKPKYEKPFQLGDMKMKGSEYFFISPAVTHRLKSIWGEDALSFRPERFFEEGCPRNNPFAYFPFGWSPRPCPGQRFAKLETKLLLARVISEYNVKLQAGLKQPFPYDVVFTMKTALKNIEMQFEKRNVEPASTPAPESLIRMRAS